MGAIGGFVWEILAGQGGAEALQALEVLHGAAVQPVGLGLIAQEQRPTIGALGHAVEAFPEGVIAVLGAGDFDIAIAGELLGHGDEGRAVATEGGIEGGGEEAGFEAGRAEEGLLGEGDALEVVEFLGGDRRADVEEVVIEAGDFVELFEAHDGKGGGGEAVLAGVLRGARQAFGGTRSGGVLGIRAVRSALLLREGMVGKRQGETSSDSRGSTPAGWSLKLSGAAWWKHRGLGRKREVTGLAGGSRKPREVRRGSTGSTSFDRVTGSLSKCWAHSMAGSSTWRFLGANPPLPPPLRLGGWACTTSAPVCSACVPFGVGERSPPKTSAMGHWKFWALLNSG